MKHNTEDGYHTDWSFISEGENSDIDIFFNHEVDLSGVESGDTITVVAVIIPFRDFITAAKYRLYDCVIIPNK